MKIAYFDCEFGAAGDMLVGSLIAAGVSLDHINTELRKLGLPEKAFALESEDAVRCAIACKKFNVFIGPDRQYEDGLYPTAANLAAVSNVASSSEVDDSNLKYANRPYLKVSDASRRIPDFPQTLQEILQFISASALANPVKELACKIFDTMFAAEVMTRALKFDEMHMHEQMALDAIIDIVGFSIGYVALGIEKAYVSTLPLGSGVFEYEKVLYSAATPATLHILKEAKAPISGRTFNNECLTVTAAAILTTVSSGWHKPAFQQVLSIGYGAGSYDPKTYPNACRVVMGTADATIFATGSSGVLAEQFKSEQIMILEANIDDLSPQSLAYAMERLLDAGALDVLVIPVVMKKGRSGHLLKVLCGLDDKAKMQQLIFNETSTIGVRSYIAERVIAERKWQNVVMGDGSLIRVKIALDQSGNVVHSQPEFEDCAAYAKKNKLPLKNVLSSVLKRFQF